MAISKTQKFIEKAKKVHGDNYDYSKSVYVRSSEKLIVICPNHGEFLISPNYHLRGGGCTACALKHNYTTEEFIEKVKEIHGDVYDYSKTVFVKRNDKITIICKKHGEFLQIAANHLNGSGCGICANRFKYTTEQFIEKAKVVHGDKFDYSDVEYKNANTKVKIFCKGCNETFEQVPSSHLYGNGCINCKKGRDPLTTEEFLETLLKNYPQNKELYDYSDTVYTGNKDNLTIKCKRCDTYFTQKADSHRIGHGCQTCNVAFDPIMFYKNKKTTLYYIRIGEFYKIGISKTPLSRRYSKRFLKEGINFEDIEIIKEIEFNDGYVAYEIEQKILNTVVEGKVEKTDSPIDGGYTEVRSFDFSDMVDNILLEYNIKG